MGTTYSTDPGSTSNHASSSVVYKTNPKTGKIEKFIVRGGLEAVDEIAKKINDRNKRDKSCTNSSRSK